MRFKRVFFFLALAATAQADWTILSTASEPGRDGLVHRHIVLEDPVGSQRITMELAIFPTKSCTLRILQNEGGAVGLGEMMRHEKWRVLQRKLRAARFANRERANDRATAARPLDYGRACGVTPRSANHSLS